MSMFNVDYSNAGAERVIPGFYEVFVSDYQLSLSKSGNQVISLFYTVRSDIDQPSQGAKIQYDNFNVIPNSKWRMDAFAKAAGIPNGTQINSAQEWAQMMVNRDVGVLVVLGAPNNSGNQYPEVKEFHATRMPNSGRPMPVLEKAYANTSNQNNGGYGNNRSYGNQNQYGSNQNQYGGNSSYNQNDPHRPADNNQNFGSYGGGHPADGYGSNNTYSSNNNLPPVNQTQAAADKIANHGNTNNAAPDNRSFANGDFGRGQDISDDDLPF